MKPWWDTSAVGSSELIGYCSFTKAIEHLGDRWSLLILRALGMFGPQGFNDLVTGLPGRISRSVLADRLRRLETLGLVSRGDGHGLHAAYRLTTVGQGLMPTLDSLRLWADSWLPDDPDMLERDPDVVLGWLAQRVDRGRLPGRLVVLEFRIYHRRDRRYWLVLQRGVEPYGCLTDPLLDAIRYVYLETSMSSFLALAQGRYDWSDAFAEGAVTAAGDPDLLGRVADWFRPCSDLETMRRSRRRPAPDISIPAPK
jgi:DNA-binding HxlR family transcriptional regulator